MLKLKNKFKSSWARNAISGYKSEASKCGIM